MIATILLYANISFLTVAFSKYAFKKRNIKQAASTKSLCFIVLWVVLVIFATFRPVGQGYGGADALEYIKYFENLDFNYISEYFNLRSLNDLLARREPLYYFLNFVIRLISSDYHVLFFVIYGFIVSSHLFFISNFYNNKSPFITLLISISTLIYSFNIIRGGISVAFSLLSFVALSNKKYWKSVFLCLVGALFHFIGIFFIFVIVLIAVVDHFKKEHSSVWLFLFAILANVAIFFLSKSISNFLSTTKYAAYLNREKTYSVIGHIPSIIVSLIAIFSYKKMKNDRKCKIIILALVVQLSLEYATIQLGIWRISDYFKLITMVFLAQSIENSHLITGKSHVLYKIIIYVLFFVVAFQAYKSLYESSCVFPYFV